MLRRSTNHLRSGYNATFYGKDTVINPSTKPVALPPLDQLTFGGMLTNNMLEADWTASEGWGAARLTEMHNLSLPPSVSSLHYALQCFEGMKAYKDAQGRSRIFRPDMNGKRMNQSVERLAIGGWDVNEFTELVKQSVRADADWIPQERGYSLYIRPTVISTDHTLGVSPPQAAKFFIINSPVGPYYKTGFKPVKLFADSVNRRACKGGVGGYKLGSNYGPTIAPMKAAAAKGCSQVLWLEGEGETLTEVGTMNLFVFLKNASGEPELVTCPLAHGTILPGVTRDSCITLAKQWGIPVNERAMGMPELVEALSAGRVLEMFGCGTACVVSQVDGILYNDKDYAIPCPTTSADSLAVRLWDEITAIQYGDKEHEWSVLVD